MKLQYLIRRTRQGTYSLKVSSMTLDRFGRPEQLLGTFHTVRGARAYAAIHAGDQPKSISLLVRA